jgi:oxygen-dependent protoporphyrinogen oxidase
MTGTPVAELERDGAGWRANSERFDQIVLAAPAHAAARVLRRVASATADALAAVEYADIAMVRLAVGGDDWPDRLAGRSGYLVPKPDQRTVTAASFGSQKWAHWSPTDGSQVLRISLGRDGLPIAHLDDDALLTAAVAETGRHLDLDLQPTTTSVTRWVDGFPQYRPHHHTRVATAEASLPAGLHLAGASYHGIGVPACIASGVAAAERIRQSGG